MRPKLLTIPGYGNVKVLGIHLGQCVSYDYKVYITCSCMLYPDSITMGQCQMHFIYESPPPLLF